MSDSITIEYGSHLSDADLRAPMLLNVSMALRAVYDLQAAGNQLNAGLVGIDRNLPQAGGRGRTTGSI